ncbi:phosphate/phosphite/phosphonate ABC transporter substrate-binding protein [Rhizobium sp. G21]|uniref:phosphate/phosphite/phosphonate ABC transporter substrate-binding protein n=1 Tax=Rhizobium sp. G21 TaxID=2758439 RepID=UPI0015FF08B2|nr:PhnD/SsuA/transferrin family substrate-binding protein [Rhizobium sp. G21]MBB1249254.1 PhnD/SsuA/transferrin family substrate-binding protein [Rhizobium sp. G21]
MSDGLDRQSHYHAVWSEPDLIFSQTCGYPYVMELREKVRLVATPIYAFAGGEGTDRASFVIAHENHPGLTLSDFRGARAAINDWMSNSGMNLFRAAIAPLAGGKPFFGSIMVSGGHVASVDAVREGLADIASVDTVTWGLLEKHAPERLAGVRIVSETPRGPGLPFITRGTTSDVELAAIRSALMDVLADPDYKSVLDTLGLKGVAILSDGDYQRLDDLRRRADAQGYTALA